MNGKKNSSGSRMNIHRSEAEVSELLKEAEQQYQECMRIADLADIADQSEPSHPNYNWDSPIGLVLGESNAKLV